MVWMVPMLRAMFADRLAIGAAHSENPTLLKSAKCFVDSGEPCVHELEPN